MKRQVTGSHQADIRMRSISCCGLMVTSLLQVVNWLDASCFNNFKHCLQVLSCTKLIFTDLIQLDEPTDLMQLDGKLASSR